MNDEQLQAILDANGIADFPRAFARLSGPFLRRVHDALLAVARERRDALQAARKGHPARSLVLAAPIFSVGKLLRARAWGIVSRLHRVCCMLHDVMRRRAERIPSPLGA